MILKKIIKWLIGITMSLLMLFAATVAVAYTKQDEIVQELLTKANKDFVGRVELDGSHISVFADFPYIDIDLEHLRIYESKSDSTRPIVELADCYAGFDLWTILSGKMEIKKIHLENGRLDIVQYPDGSFNVAKAFESTLPPDSVNSEFHLDLQSILLRNVAVSKLNVESGMLIDINFSEAVTSLRSTDSCLYAGLDSHFEMSMLMNGDTSFIKHKHFELGTDFVYNNYSQLMTFEPTEAKLEGAVFNLEGSLDFSRDVFLDVKFSGNKPNFELFMAMAPPEMAPALARYDNKGEIQFYTTIVGSCINGKSPAVNAAFNCKNAYLNNKEVNKKLDELNFSGYFTNGDLRHPSTMEFGIRDFSARPEAGLFRGDLVVKNFESPDIELKLVSDFELNFLAKFFGLTDLYDLAGKVELTMNFKDIIDLEHPERSIGKLNESYYTLLKVDNLSFGKESTELPVKDVDIYAVMEGHEARIDYCNVLVGNSDISLKGSVSDLPAIIHHTDAPVNAKLEISSTLLDMFELTGKDSLAFNEQIRNAKMQLHFQSSARNFTESPNLPVGEFFIDNLTAQLTHYPHTLHDFHADVFIDPQDFRVIDFKGLIDKSDFHFTGKLSHYDLWFAEVPRGDTHLDFDLKSDMLHLEDVFSYQGANYVPEDYRHEEFDHLHLSGAVDMHFQDSLQSIDLALRDFGAKMKVHAMRFDDFRGRVHYEKDHLIVDKFAGSLGHSDIQTTLHYYLGADEAQKKRENKFELNCKRLDFDQLFQYQTPTVSQSTGTSDVAYHDEGFNIYELPFTDMTFDVKIGEMNYKKYLLQNINGEMRTTPNHKIYINELVFKAADGDFKIKGVLDGSDPKHIFFDPEMEVNKVDLDKLFFKFDNFDQDYLVSENLHGTISAKINGHVRIHKDFAPILDESEVHLDINVYDGILEHFSMLDAMADYFKDKNLDLVRFDTLSNHMDLNKGILQIPQMTINSSLGFMEISGSQDMDLNMDYFIRIPWKLVTEAASSKLFGKKRDEVDSAQVDEIQTADPNKKIRYLNIRMKGNTKDYSITLEKDKRKK